MSSLLSPLAGTTPDSQGYWLTTADGTVYSFGSAPSFPPGTTPPSGRVVGLTATPDGQGYWLATATGGVYSFGDARFFGAGSTQHVTGQVVGLTATPDGRGYWLASSDGGVYSFGDAPFLGAGATQPLPSPVVSLTATPDGQGYWLVTSTGAVLSFGDAPYLGDANSFGPAPVQPLAGPVVSLTATPDGQGYWLATATGGVYSFGDAPFLGAGLTQHLTSPVVGLTAAPDGQGYWLATVTGGVYSFGDARFYGSGSGTYLGVPVVGLVVPVASPTASIPLRYLALDHQAAATCPGLPWSVLAGIGTVESDFGRSGLPGVHSGTNFAGAAGPMQLGIGGQAGPTFFRYDHPIAADPAVTPAPPGATPPNPWNPDDAVYAAARDLCANGGASPDGLGQAIFAYNHSATYVTDVESLASFYDGRGLSGDAVQLALGQVGTPYVWGGTTPGVGFDCSGLIQWIYSQLGLALPRTSQQQWAALPHLAATAPLRPGDLVFFGPVSGPTHVGLYIGNGLMIDAPHTGADVRVEPYNWPDYLGATIP